MWVRIVGMPHKRDRIFWAAAILLAVTMIVWIGGYFYRLDLDYMRRPADGSAKDWSFSTFNGEVSIYDGFVPASPDNARQLARAKQGFLGGISRNNVPTFIFLWSHAGFYSIWGMRNFERLTSPISYDVGIPLWFVAIVLLVFVVWRYRVLRKRRR